MANHHKKAKLSSGKGGSRPKAASNVIAAPSKQSAKRNEPLDEPSGASESEELSEAELDMNEDVVDNESDESESDVSEVEDEEDDSEEEESEEEDEEESTDAPVRKGDGFDTAMSAILGSRVKAHDASNPILIRNKRSAREIDDAREEAKARRALRREKLQYKDKARVRDVIPRDPEEAGEAISRERMLRKTAQRGVVRLLNAINSAQTAALAGDSTDKHEVAAATDVSKEKFLDMIRMG